MRRVLSVYFSRWGNWSREGFAPWRNLIHWANSNLFTKYPAKSLRSKLIIGGILNRNPNLHSSLSTCVESRECSRKAHSSTHMESFFFPQHGLAAVMPGKAFQENASPRYAGDRKGSAALGAVRSMRTAFINSCGRGSWWQKQRFTAHAFIRPIPSETAQARGGPRAASGHWTGVGKQAEKWHGRRSTRLLWLPSRPVITSDCNLESASLFLERGHPPWTFQNTHHDLWIRLIHA